MFPSGSAAFGAGSDKMENTRSKVHIDMCEGAILPKMIRFSIPLMLSGILQLLFNAADIVVVGRFAGEASLAAVGSTGSLTNLMINLFVGMSIGANVTMAHFIGSGKRRDIRLTVHTSMLLSMICGVFLTILGFFGAEKALTMMETPPEVLPLAATYLKIYFLGMTSNMVYNFGSAILRASGDTQRPLVYLTVAGVINVVLNLIFVIGFKLDVAGVAAATAISQTVSAVLIVRCLMKEEGAIKLIPQALAIDPKKLKMILAVGIPAGFQGMMFSFSNVVIQSSVNSFGGVVVAGNSAAQNIEGFVYTAMNSFYQATVSFTGQNYGAGKYERIDKILMCALGCVFLTGTVLGSAVIWCSRSLLGIYSDNADVIALGMVRIRVIVGTYALLGMQEVLVGNLRGIGQSLVPTIVSFIFICGLRILWIATAFQIPEFHTPRTIFYSYPISWGAALFANLICVLFMRKRYMSQKREA